MTLLDVLQCDMSNVGCRGDYNIHTEISGAVGYDKLAVIMLLYKQVFKLCYTVSSKCPFSTNHLRIGRRVGFTTNAAGNCGE